MVRPIRIPQSQVGAGAPAVLPSAAALSAPARATADLAQNVGGAVARGVANFQRKADNLTLIREGAEVRAKINNGKASLSQQLEDHGVSEDYTEEGHRALYEKGIEAIYADAGEAASHPQLKAQLEGGRAGDLANDLGPELERQTNRRDARGIQFTADAALDELITAPIDAIPDLAILASAALDVFDNPEMRANVSQQRTRIFRAAEARYKIAGGQQGEIRFLADLAAGEFNDFGLDVIGPVAEDIGNRLPKLAAGVLEQWTAENDHWNEVDNGGVFGGFEITAALDEIEALRIETKDLDDRSRNMMHRALDAAELRVTRRNESMQNMEAWFEDRGRLGHLPPGGEDDANWNHFFTQNGIKFLEDPVVSQDEKVKLLTRASRDFGSFPPAMATWIQGNMPSNNSNPDPETLAMIAKSFALMSPLTPTARAAADSNPELFAELSGTVLPDIKQIASDSDLAVLDSVARSILTGKPAATAVEEALNNRELNRGGGRGTTGKELNLEEIQKSNEAARQLEKDLIKQLGDMGVEATELAPSAMSEIRKSTADGFLRNKETMFEGDALKAAQNEALRKFSSTSPPVEWFNGRIILSGPLAATLEGGRFPSEMIRFEVEQAMNELGEQTTDGNLMERVDLVQLKGQGLADNEFFIQVSDPGGGGRMIIDPASGTPARLRIKGDESDWQKIQEGRRASGMEQRYGAEFKGRPDAVRNDVIEASFLTANRFAGRYGSQAGAPVEKTDAFNAAPTATATLGPRQQDQTFLDKREALFSNVPDGSPLWAKNPELQAAWDAEFRAKSKALRDLGKNAARSDAGPGASLQRPPTAEEADRIARGSADAVVKERLEFEFKNANPADLFRFLETGLFPGEAGPPAPKRAKKKTPAGLAPPPNQAFPGPKFKE